MKTMCCLLLVMCVCGYGTVMNAEEQTNRTSIFEAASGGDLTTVSNFVAQGGDVNLRDDRPLRGYTLLMAAVSGQSPNICEYLLAKGADVSLRSKAGLTALILAKQQYEISLPSFYEKRIASAERRLKTVKEEKYREATRKRLELYKKQYKEADTSEEAQARAKRIVEMLEKKVAEQEEKNARAPSSDHE